MLANPVRANLWHLISNFFLEIFWRIEFPKDFPNLGAYIAVAFKTTIHWVHRAYPKSRFCLELYSSVFCGKISVTISHETGHVLSEAPL